MNRSTNGKGNNPSRDEWITPNWVFDPLDKQYNFNFDCCATEENTKCDDFADDFEFLDEVFDPAWMNPPFSKAWKMFEHFFDVVVCGVAIYRCDNFETAIWQKIIFPQATWVLIPDRRVSFEGLDGDGARFPSALIGFNVSKPTGVKGVLLEKFYKIKFSDETGV